MICWDYTKKGREDLDEIQATFRKLQGKVLSAICLPQGTYLALWELGLCYLDYFRYTDLNLKEQKGEKTRDWE